MICIFVWTNGDPQALERSVPLLWHGGYLKNREWKNNLTVIFLEGFGLLPPDYFSDLATLGYSAIDGTAMVAAERENYPGIEALPKTEQYWFLRWNVLEQIRAIHPEIETIIHLDGDCVFLASPESVYRDVQGKTFVLEGCSAFAAISDKRWFTAYREALGSLIRNRSDFISRAMAIKNDPPKPGREYCNSLLYNEGWFQDQDLIEYLIGAGSLPQDTTATVFDSGYYWIQNPLFPGEWFDEQFEEATRPAPRLYEREGSFVVGCKELPFLHLQQAFVAHVRYSLILEDMRLRSAARRLKPDLLTAQPGICGRLLVMCIKALSRVSGRIRLKYASRCAVAERLLRPPKGAASVSSILSSYF